MAPIQLLPQHLQAESDPDTAKEHELLTAALSMLPAEAHQRILADFVLTARQCDITRDYSPLRHLSDSLFVTARLNRSSEYRDAVVNAEQAERGEVVGMSDYLDMLRAKTF